MEANSPESITFTQLATASLQWHVTGNPLIPYRSEHENVQLKLRINNFPDEQMYSLMLENGAVIANFDDWPVQWKRPGRLWEALDIAKGFVWEFFGRRFQHKLTPPTRR